MPIAALALLFVAAGLLLVLAVSIGRRRGREASRRDTALMAGMTGVAAGFLLLVLPVPPLILLPLVVAGTLCASWLADRRWTDLGAFLVGFGLLWSVSETLSLVNDLGDPAVTRPAWTPVPFAIAVAGTIIGVTLLVVGARRAPSE